MKIFKWLGIVIFSLILILIFFGWLLNKPLPKGINSAKANEVAQKMLESLNKNAYDSVEVISWDYLRGYSYIWNKNEHVVSVSWEDFEVTLNTINKTGQAFKSGEQLLGQEKGEVITMAWKRFANDSFWLVAPFKVFDDGTERYLVNLEDGNTGLLVTYKSGGVTPGDSYLWILDNNYIPIAYKMWVQIIPIGGVEFQWTDWQEFGGAKIATNHIGPFGVELPIRNLKVQ